jgi:hypothetical protein
MCMRLLPRCWAVGCPPQRLSIVAPQHFSASAPPHLCFETSIFTLAFTNNKLPFSEGVARRCGEWRKPIGQYGRGNGVFGIRLSAHSIPLALLPRLIHHTVQFQRQREPPQRWEDNARWSTVWPFPLPVNKTKTQRQAASGSASAALKLAAQGR